jgi:hypothetical protein
VASICQVLVILTASLVLVVTTALLELLLTLLALVGITVHMVHQDTLGAQPLALTVLPIPVRSSLAQLGNTMLILINLLATLVRVASICQVLVILIASLVLGVTTVLLEQLPTSLVRPALTVQAAAVAPPVVQVAHTTLKQLKQPARLVLGDTTALLEPRDIRHVLAGSTAPVARQLG